MFFIVLIYVEIVIYYLNRFDVDGIVFKYDIGVI